MRVLFIFVLLLHALGCSTTGTKTVSVEKPFAEAALDANTMLRRLGYTPELDGTADVFTLRGGSLSAALIPVSDNETTLILRGNKRYLNYIYDFFLQSDERFSQPAPAKTDKNLFTLFSFHAISPGFSGLYAAHENPLSGDTSPWLRFFLHTGIDAAGLLLTATNFFQEEFQFSGWSLAFLLVHRMATLPSFSIEVDHYNRAVGGRFLFRF